MKLGIIEDGSNRQRLSKLLRFTSSKSPKTLTSLDDYVERMKSSQKKIYFIIGKSPPALQFYAIGSRQFLSANPACIEPTLWTAQKYTYIPIFRAISHESEIFLALGHLAEVLRYT